jgi:RNA polymerase sigma-70 factor (ECF subfamily)
MNGSFAEKILPHLDAAYTLARWLVRNDADADDIVQEAYLRAFRYGEGFRGGDPRAWLLRIVRNTAYQWIHASRAHQPLAEFDELVHTSEAGSANPETLMMQNADSEIVERALSALPVRFREVLVLRELQGLTYKEIAEVVSMPIGTVMSSLSRARDRFRQAVSRELSANPSPGQHARAEF